MNRAQRRHLKATVKRMVTSGPGLTHPVPDSVVLRGGPMDGWIVKPDAPALEPDWRDRFLEATASANYDAARLAGKLPKHVPDAPDVMQSFRAAARIQHGAGRYELGSDGRSAAWVVTE